MHARRDQRPQRVLPGRRIAAGARNQPRALDLVAVEFGQAIDRLFLHLDRRMGLAIPFFVFRRVAQPEIGATDRRSSNVSAAWRSLPASLHEEARRSTSQCWKNRSRRSSTSRGRSRWRRKGKTSAIAMPRLAVGRQRGDRHVRMGGNQTHQFCARIARGAENGDPMGHGKAPVNVFAALFRPTSRLQRFANAP